MRSFLIAALVFSMILSGTLTAFGAEKGGTGVQYNGNDIALKGASVEIINGSAMAPLRQLLEAMGANVAYDSKSKVITAKLSDKEISLKAGETDITVSENGTESVKKMDMAPFVNKKNNSIYVPARSLFKSLGYSVGWDDPKNTLVIIDPATLFADADEDFSIVCLLMKSSLDLEKPYSTTGQFDMGVTTYANPESIMPGMSYSVSGKLSGIQQKSNADLVMNLAFDFSKMLSSLPAEQKILVQPMLDAYKNVDMKMKMNGETGTAYINSGILSTLTGNTDGNTWYKMNVYKPYEDMGIDIRTMAKMSSNIDISKLLEDSAAAMPNVDTSTYQDMKTMYLFAKNLIGDNAFSTRTTAGVNTHTLYINKASVIKAMAVAGLTAGLDNNSTDLAEMESFMTSMDLGTNIIIRDTAGTLSSYDLNGNFSMEAAKGSFKLSGDSKSSTANIVIDQKDVMNMSLNFKSRIAETSQQPDLEIPDGAKVVDLDKMLNPGL
jgi:Copper amine oxidase N-terminal domain.